MSASHPPKDEQKDPSVSEAPRSEVIKQSREVVDTARDTLARAHQAFDRTRQLRKKREDILHYNRARRERKAEHAASLTPPASRAVGDIVLIEDNPADVTLFRYALKESALPYQVTVLTQKSEVEAWICHAASTGRPPPRLIVLDYRIPGMEAEEILAAVRTVPAYRRVPVVFFSALEEAEGHRRSVQRGATAFVHKPGDLAATVAAVTMLVRRWGGGGNESAAERKARAAGQEPSAD